MALVCRPPHGFLRERRVCIVCDARRATRDAPLIGGWTIGLLVQVAQAVAWLPDFSKLNRLFCQKRPSTSREMVDHKRSDPA